MSDSLQDRAAVYVGQSVELGDVGRSGQDRVVENVVRLPDRMPIKQRGKVEGPRAVVGADLVDVCDRESGGDQIGRDEGLVVGNAVELETFGLAVEQTCLSTNLEQMIRSPSRDTDEREEAAIDLGIKVRHRRLPEPA